MKKIRLHDATLREDAQIPGAPLTVRQRLIIARSLDFLGIDAIEVGNPGASLDVDEFIAEVKGEQLKAELIVQTHACYRAVEAALKTEIGTVAVFLGISDIQLHLQMASGVDRACLGVYRSVEELVDSGRKVRFSAGEVTRENFDVLLELCNAALDAGAGSISLHDTLGIALPDDLRSIFASVKSRFPRPSLEAACRNDLGLAVVNSLAAMEGGADCLHVTVNGLGERAGITPLFNLAVALKLRYGIDTVDLRSVNEISGMVSSFGGVNMPGNAYADDAEGRERPKSEEELLDLAVAELGKGGSGA